MELVHCSGSEVQFSAFLAMYSLESKMYGINTHKIRVTPDASGPLFAKFAIPIYRTARNIC